MNEFFRTASELHSWGHGDSGYWLLSVMFGLAGIGFLIAYCRDSSMLPVKIAAPTGLCFDSKLQIESDGNGRKKVSVILRNHGPQAMGGIVVTLEGLTAKRFADAHRKLNAHVQLVTEVAGEVPLGPLVLEPGKAAAFVVAQSKVGEGFFCVPFRHRDDQRHDIFQVSLAPYVATVTAGADNIESTSVQIELPVAGRGIGQPKVRGQHRNDQAALSCNTTMPA